MNLHTALRAALRALTANLLRSVLTMLGVIIGVGAVIAMLAVGRGATERVQEQIKGLGSNIVLVVPGSLSAAGVRLGAQTRSRFTEEDAEALAREVPEVQVAAPSSRTTAQAVAQSANWNTTIFGTTNDYLEAREWPLAAGRLFEAAEQQGSAKVAWLGQTAARELFADDDPLGQTVRVRGVPFTVVGVLAAKGQNAVGQDQDDIVIVPMSTFRNRIWNAGGNVRRIWSIHVKVRAGADMARAEESMRTLLRQRLRVPEGGDDTFSIRNLSEVLQAQEESSRVMTALLAAVAGVSLLVGGIGIMNIMLVSVTERTREIGLRMAVGARGRDILAQFLIESVTLSLVGGAIGVALGVLATWAVERATGWSAVMEPWSVLLAVGFAGLVGVFFGYYPARRAARLQPIVALRHE
ncbi:MAG TPA: ABC transporter permease [Giesbergeria sp.]|nr:ABC transporter permease [Giesbergeria sp.]